MNIRNALSVVLAFFSLSLVLFSWSQGTVAYKNYQRVSEQLTIDSARNSLLAATVRLQDDSYKIAQLGSAVSEFSSSDVILNAAADQLRNVARVLNETGDVELRRLSAALLREVDIISLYAAEFATTVAFQDRDIQSVQLFQLLAKLDLVRNRLLDIRQALLQEAGFTTTTMASLHLVRTYVVTVNSYFHDIRIGILQELQEDIGLRARGIENIRDQTQSLLAFDIMYSNVVELVDDDIRRSAESLSDTLTTFYVPAQDRLLLGLETSAELEAVQDAWLGATEQVDQLIQNALVSIFERSQMTLTSDRNEALSTLRRSLAISFFVFLTLGFSLFFIVRHIVSPLDELRGRMQNIVDGNLKPFAKGDFLLKDIHAIADALRVFRIAEVQRDRSRHTQLKLYAQISETHQMLQSDMKSAAQVQLALLPRPGKIEDFYFSTFFAPSKMLAGDTFDHFRLSENRVGLFQIDVAGHGAAAGLVSVAAQIAARRALRSLKPHINLAGAMSTLNAHWNSELTYFTMVMAELDATSNTGRLVQAGHPHPLLLKKDGPLTRLGNGGLPVGVVSDAEFEEIEFPFHPGDRLIIFTDGAYENVNKNNEIYTEERLLQFLTDNVACDTNDLVHNVRELLKAWSGIDNLSDDVSLMVVERL